MNANRADTNRRFVGARSLPPLNITCLGAAGGDLQDARFESGLDNSPMSVLTWDAGAVWD